MSRKSEREFVGEGMSDEDFAALNGDASEPIETASPEPQQETALPASTEEGQAPAESAPPAQAELKMVDVRALQEARAEIRRRDEELAKTKADQIRIEERLNLLNEALARNQPAEPAPKIPDLVEEPLDHLDWRLKEQDGKFKTLEERLVAFEKAQDEQRKSAEAEIARQHLIGEVDMVLAAAGQQHQDVGEALGFAANGIRQEIHRLLTQQGVTGQDYVNRANQMWDNELTRLAQHCPKDPDGAAEFVRRNARWWGWTGPQAAQAQQQPLPATPQAPQAQQPTLQQRAEQQQRHMSLSGVSGAEPPKALDAKAIANMSDKEWKEFVKTAAGKKAMEEHFGGL